MTDASPTEFAGIRQHGGLGCGLHHQAVELGFEDIGGGQNHYRVEAIHGEEELIGADGFHHAFGIGHTAPEICRSMLPIMTAVSFGTSARMVVILRACVMTVVLPTGFCLRQEPIRE